VLFLRLQQLLSISSNSEDWFQNIDNYSFDELLGCILCWYLDNDEDDYVNMYSCEKIMWSDLCCGDELGIRGWCMIF